MTPKQLLTEAKSLITLPEHWTQGALIRDKDGHRYIDPDYDGTAFSFCAYGAMTYIAGTQFDPALGTAADIFRMVLGNSGIGPFNDAPHRSHIEILSAFDEAINACP